MMIEVEAISEDGLRRRVWRFGYGSGHFLTLTRYADEDRASPRHKFRAIAQWDAMDERTYHSQLPRPQYLPEWVVSEAMAKLPPPTVTIGWRSLDFLAAIVPEQKVCL